MNIEQLRRFLESYDIPLDKWGKGKAKTLENFLKELNSGESQLTSVDGKLFRSALGSVAVIHYFDYPFHSVLTEVHQIMSNGKIYSRDIPFSIGEKVLPNESSLEAVYRAFKEELAIEEKLKLRERPGYVQGPVPSTSYPGIITTYFVDVWFAMMPKHLYKRVYTEVQPDKTSQFVWTPYYIWKSRFPARSL
ncbi:MAG: hypothetical protein KBD10_00530 [Candidatus Pacebacteria bacterium]|nr:hypothetical protein [Candidatus Paceibacterota bacterium]